MFLDASIVVAILASEDDWALQTAKVEAHRDRLFHSAMVRFEVVTALARLGEGQTGRRPSTAMFEGVEKLFDSFVREMGSTEIAVTADIGRQAVIAAKTYGKIVGHRAALNFGDCFSYAAAKTMGVGLLYKGNDFSLTDLG